MKKYFVEVAEVHYRMFRVTAKNEDEAKTLVKRQAPEVVDCRTLEYSHELNQDAWHVEEEPSDEDPIEP